MSSLEAAQDFLDRRPEPCKEIIIHPMDEFNKRFFKHSEKEDAFKEPLTYAKYIKLREMMNDCSLELHAHIMELLDGSEYS